MNRSLIALATALALFLARGRPLGQWRANGLDGELIRSPSARPLGRRRGERTRGWPRYGGQINHRTRPDGLWAGHSWLRTPVGVWAAG
jgi:hypothetical protein